MEGVRDPLNSLALELKSLKSRSNIAELKWPMATTKTYKVWRRNITEEILPHVNCTYENFLLPREQQ